MRSANDVCYQLKLPNRFQKCLSRYIPVRYLLRKFCCLYFLLVNVYYFKDGIIGKFNAFEVLN